MISIWVPQTTYKKSKICQRCRRDYLSDNRTQKYCESCKKENKNDRTKQSH